jgi:AraC-like DNA-binding protein
MEREMQFYRLIKALPNPNHRKKQATKLIAEDFTKNQTVEALSQQAGFSNRTVFNSVFKKQTGVTPTFFIANYKKQAINPNGLK